MTVSYGLVENFEGWSGASALFQSLIEIHSSKRILEIGSGANPTLTPEYVRANGLSYVTSDLSSEELAKADSAFETLVLDMSANNLDPTFNGSFDLICSRMVNEHIRSGRQYHSNIHSLLRPGGIAVHCFSTLWTLPFAANRALPEPLSDFLLRVFNPREDAHKHGKFRAYYSWSRGPTRQMLERFNALGFQIVRYTGYFGHPYYRRVLPLQHLEKMKSQYLLRHPNPQLCSYATLVLRKST